MDLYRYYILAWHQRRSLVLRAKKESAMTGRADPPSGKIVNLNAVVGHRGESDPELRDLCASWVRLLVAEGPDEAVSSRLSEIANGLASITAATPGGIRYKLVAAIAHTLSRDGEADNVVVEFLTSAVSDLDALDGLVGRPGEKPAT